MNKYILSLAIATCFSSFATAEERHVEAHEHGVSALQIAQQNNELLFVLESPASDIVGFEHAAENEADQKAIDQALAIFAKPDALFTPSASANCSLKSNEAEFETDEDHAEFHVSWTMSCEAINKVDALSIGFFAEFENASEVEAVVVGDMGQGAMEIESDETELDLSSYIGN